MATLDPFLFFKNMLFVFLLGYYTFAMITLGIRVYRLLEGKDRGKELARVVASYHLLTTPLKPFQRELLGVTLWAVAAGLALWIQGVLRI